MSPWTRISELLEKNHVSSKDLANIAGVSPSAITKWKSGSSIRSAALTRIAIHFGVSTDYLMNGQSPPIDTAELLKTAAAALHEKIRLQGEMIESQKQTIASQKGHIATLEKRCLEWEKWSGLISKS